MKWVTAQSYPPLYFNMQLCQWQLHCTSQPKYFLLPCLDCLCVSFDLSQPFSLLMSENGKGMGRLETGIRSHTRRYCWDPPSSSLPMKRLCQQLTSIDGSLCSHCCLYCAAVRLQQWFGSTQQRPSYRNAWKCLALLEQWLLHLKNAVGLGPNLPALREKKSSMWIVYW